MPTVILKNHRITNRPQRFVLASEDGNFGEVTCKPLFYFAAATLLLLFLKNMLNYLDRNNLPWTVNEQWNRMNIENILLKSLGGNWQILLVHHGSGSILPASNTVTFLSNLMPQNHSWGNFSLTFNCHARYTVQTSRSEEFWCRTKCNENIANEKM